MKKENILIAEFMERSFKPYRDNFSANVPFKTFEECRKWIANDPYENKTRMRPQIGWEDLGESYESNWSALMPVIEKIAVLSLTDPDNASENWNPHPRTFGVPSLDNPGYFMFRLNRFQLFECPTLIDAAYTAVVDFLTWYAKNGQQGIKEKEQRKCVYCGAPGTMDDDYCQNCGAI